MNKYGKIHLPSYSEMCNKHYNVLYRICHFDGVTKYFNIVVLVRGKIQKLGIFWGWISGIKFSDVKGGISHLEAVRSHKIQSMPSDVATSLVSCQPSWKPTLSWWGNWNVFINKREKLIYEQMIINLLWIKVNFWWSKVRAQVN